MTAATAHPRTITVTRRRRALPPSDGRLRRLEEVIALAECAKLPRMRRVALVLAAMVLGPSAFAAGIDSRAYACPGLQALIAANRFVFINNPGFGDFVVADRSYCSFSEIIQRRTVPTIDNPECIVNYCRPPTESRGAGS